MKKELLLSSLRKEILKNIDKAFGEEYCYCRNENGPLFLITKTLLEKEKGGELLPEEYKNLGHFELTKISSEFLDLPLFFSIRVLLDGSEWVERFKPIKNETLEPAGFDNGFGGILFDAFYNQNLLSSTPKNKIWSWGIGEGGEEIMSKGYGEESEVKNFLGFFICEVEWEEGDDYFISKGGIYPS
jgi:hypothetical protein